MATDEELAGLAAHGDEPALRELLRRYERPLSSFIHRHTSGRDVEDLYQETWLRVVRHAARFDRTKRFSTWLFQIAVNLCRDWHRRPPPEPTDVPDTPESDVALAASDARLDAARLLAQLPEPQREVVILRYYHDLTEEETARILGCPQGTVKSRLHHALAHLARLGRLAGHGST
jgi:RNA polymerase sigma-70 factor (ECF subfamily)